VIAITAASVHPYALPFVTPVVTARGRFTHRRGWLLAVDDDHGRRGWGDAAPWPGFASSDEEVTGAMGRVDEALVGASFEDMDAIAAWLERSALPPEVRHAVELSLLDLFAQTRGVPLAALLGDDPAPRVRSHALVGATVDQTADVHKLKVGRDLDDDEARLAHLRAAVGARARIRLDAAGAYSPSQARAALSRFARYGIELMEQPIAPGQLGAVTELAAFAASSSIALAADEELAAGTPFDAVLASYHAVVLKPMFLGGIRVALTLAQRAHAAGRDVVVTHALESAIGRAGAVHLASLVAGVHGLGDALAHDLGPGPIRRGNHVTRPAAAGLGVTPDPQWQHAQAIGRASVSVTEPLALPNPIAAAAQSRPHHAALVCDGRTWSYHALADEVARRAQVLRGRGLEHGRRVALVGPRDAEWVLWFHAIGWLGAEVAPLDPQAPEAERRRALAAADADAILDTGSPGPQPPGPSLAPASWAPQEHRVVVTTSGSTGQPRVVPLTTQQLVLSAFGSAIRLGHDPSDRWLCCLPLHHVGGLSILLRSAWYGTTVVLHPRFDADAVGRALDSGDASLVSLVPSMLERVLDARRTRRGTDEPLPRSVRAILVGGAATPAPLRQRARAIAVPLALTWGMTEAASQVATGSPGDYDAGPAIGPPLPFAMLDTSADRLRIRGPLVGGQLETADRGMLDEQGRVIIVGRADAAILSGGETIDPAEIEHALRAHPAVADAAVVALPSAEWGARPHAALTLEPGMAAPDDPELTQHLRERIARFKVPDQFLWCEALPRTALGKIARGRVRTLFATNQDSTATPPPPRRHAEQGRAQR
jgi:o-succinylbenzoate---CoA ligase